MAENKQRLTADDLWKFERVGGLSLSADGDQAVCSVSSHSMDDNKSQASLWLLSTEGAEPRRLTSCGEKDGQPAWAPAGGQIAFIAKREQQGEKDETPQLYLIAADGGEARRASRFAPGIEAFKWFPDGRRIAFIAWVWPELAGTKAQAKAWRAFKDRKATGYVTSEAQYRFWDHNLPMGRVLHLHVLDVDTGRITDLFEGTPYELPRAEPSAAFFDIAPDGRHLVFAYDPAPQKRIDNFKALVELKLSSSRFETVACDPQWDFDSPRFRPDGDAIAFIAANSGVRHTMPGRLALLRRDAGSSKKARRAAGPAAPAANVEPRGARSASRLEPGDARAAGPGPTGDWQVLSDDWDHAVTAPLRWAADGGAVFFTAEDRGRNHLYRFDVAERRASVVAEGGWVQGFDLAGDRLASVADGLSHPARVSVQQMPTASGVGRTTDAPRRIERFNDALLASFDLGRCEEVGITGAQGETLQMWLVYPPAFDRKKKYPVLHNIHGGPHAAAGDTFHYRWNTHVFAARGYVVACVNYHGSSGFGQAFLDSITHRWGELELQDIEAGTDWLLQQPWADKKRFFAAGGSYGGFMVAWMNGHVAPGRYNAYICHAGCFDWTAMFSDDAYTWHAKELGAWYWQDGDKVRSQSPSHYVAAMQTPTLVIHGALDYRVPDQQGLAYYNTLQACGIDTRLLWYPDENHWILKPQNAQLWYAEFFAWLERHDPKGKDGKPALRLKARSLR